MPKSKPYLFHPEAWQELEAADDWYRERSLETSVRFLSAVLDGLDSIVQRPQSWPKYFHGTQRFILFRFPFSIIYLDEPEVINIIAIAHHKRRPGYWKERM